MTTGKGLTAAESKAYQRGITAGKRGREDALTTIIKELETERDALKALNAELVEALNKAADTFRDFARADHALGKPIRAAASEVAETATRAVLAKVSL